MLLLMLFVHGSQAGQAQRQLVHFGCPSNIEDHEQLCQAVTTAVAAVIPSSVVVPRGDEVPVRAEDVSVTLVLAEVTKRGMTGRLDWQIGQGSRQTGTEVRFSVTDSSLSPQMYEIFARSLVKASEKMVNAIKSAGRESDRSVSERNE